MLHAVWLYMDAYDPIALILRGVLVVGELQRDMIVKVMLPLVEGAHTKTIPPLSCGSWQVINNPIHLIVVLDHALELVLVFSGQRDRAQLLAILVDKHLYLVGGVLNHVTHQGLPEILDGIFDPFMGPAVGKVVVAVRQLRLDGQQLVHLEVYQLLFCIFLGGKAGQVYRPSQRPVKRHSKSSQDTLRPGHQEHYGAADFSPPRAVAPTPTNRLSGAPQQSRANTA
mmetsp:Transcript_40418/g.88378  ORF Transcript_40418/g.88378 Transcript_40418/m.88378 type:complete len:226 (-) Transcript_40418:5-682(-)